MADRYLMALDAGSGSGRCLVINLDGEKYYSTKRDWSYYSPEGGGLSASEFDPQQFWEILCDCIQTTMKKAGIGGEEIAAVSSTSQREGIVILDEAGKELYAGPNRDFRGAMEGMLIANQYGDEIYARSGHYPSGIFACARILWFKKNKVDIFSKFHTLLSLNDWVLYRLSGERACEPTNASETALYDIQQEQWMEDIIQKLGLPSLFPKVLDAGTVIGEVSNEVAQKTGLMPGTAVVIGGADSQCGMLGCGLSQVGQIAAVSGTTTPVQMIVDKSMLDPEVRTWADPYVIPGMFVVESNAGGSGSIFQWVRDVFCESEIIKSDDAQAYVLMSEIASQAPEGSNGILSHFGVMIMNAKKIGMPPNVIVLGLSPMAAGSQSAKPLILRSILESLAYAVKANTDQILRVSGVSPKFMAVCGGLAQSELYNSLIADILELPIQVPVCKEASGVGAAICAGIGGGIFHGFEEGIQAIVKVEKTIEPDAERSRKYKGFYKKWLKSYLSYL